MKFDELCMQYDCDDVAPLAGAWIEITYCDTSNYNYSSLPSLERGLKSLQTSNCMTSRPVAPLAGAWIEMSVLPRIPL